VFTQSTERRIEVLETLRRQDFQHWNFDRFGTEIAQSLTEFSGLVRSAGHQHPAAGER
jgi:hypothetical protein